MIYGRPLIDVQNTPSPTYASVVNSLPASSARTRPHRVRRQPLSEIRPRPAWLRSVGGYLRVPDSSCSDDCRASVFIASRVSAVRPSTDRAPTARYRQHACMHCRPSALPSFFDGLTGNRLPFYGCSIDDDNDGGRSDLVTSRGLGDNRSTGRWQLLAGEVEMVDHEIDRLTCHGRTIVYMCYHVPSGGVQSHRE